MLRIRVKNRSTSNFTKDSSRCCNTSRLAARIIYFFNFDIMIVGIDASRAFLRRRTGIEEYAYQTIKHLRSVIPETDTVVLYVRKRLAVRDGRLMIALPEIDFALPEHWSVRGIWAPRFWTQIRLSLEMLFHRPDVLLVPAH